MNKILLMAILLGAFLVIPNSSAYTLSVRLNISNTVNTIYIPGMGERDSSSLGSETSYSSPDHFYLASYSGGFLSGLASKSGESLVFGNGESSHFLEIEQNLTGSRVFLASTQGNWHDMDSRISLIEAGTFLSQVSPSFAFSLGGLYPVMLLLKYPNMDMEGDFILGKGQHRLVIENRGLSGGKPVVRIKQA
jgi:hypothetical protein